MPSTSAPRTESPRTTSLPSTRPLTRTAPRLLALAAAAGLLVACSSAAETNEIGESPTQGQVVRTPSPLGTDLPSTDPPLTQDLPGATGGPAGTVPTTAAPASPGEDEDGGGDSPAN